MSQMNTRSLRMFKVVHKAIIVCCEELEMCRVNTVLQIFAVLPLCLDRGTT